MCILDGFSGRVRPSLSVAGCGATPDSGTRRRQICIPDTLPSDQSGVLAPHPCLRPPSSTPSWSIPIHHCFRTPSNAAHTMKHSLVPPSLSRLPSLRTQNTCLLLSYFPSFSLSILCPLLDNELPGLETTHQPVSALPQKVELNHHHVNLAKEWGAVMIHALFKYTSPRDLKLSNKGSVVSTPSCPVLRSLRRSLLFCPHSVMVGMEGLPRTDMSRCTRRC